MKVHKAQQIASAAVDDFLVVDTAVPDNVVGRFSPPTVARDSSDH